MKKIMRRVLACSGCILLSVTGCLQTPDMEYVANKEGQSTLISDNTIKVDGSSIAEQIMAPARAEAICEKVNEYTSIKIDADIILPEENAIPIYGVIPMKVTEETLQDYTSVLYDTGEFCNRINRTGFDLYTEEELYELIDSDIQLLNSAPVTEVEETIWDDDGNMLEMSKRDAESINSCLELVRQELDTREESPDYGGDVRYEFETQETSIKFGDMNDWSRQSYVYETATYVGRQSNGNDYYLVVVRDGMNVEMKFLMRDNIDFKYGHIEGDLDTQTTYRGGRSGNFNTCTYSPSEATEMCRKFLTTLGIEHMEVGRIEDIDWFYDNGQREYLGTEGYLLYFYWSAGGIQEPFSPKRDKEMATRYTSTMGVDSSSLYSQMSDLIYEKDEECELTRFPTIAAIRVTNDGITAAWIQNPLLEQGLQAENVKLLAFDQVLQLGVSKLEALYGDSGRTGAYGHVDIEIGTIELNYARMQAPYSQEDYTMIPVWDFRNEEDGEVKLTLNAIDGSIFDREEGY